MKFIEKYYKGIIIFLSLGALVAVSGVVKVVIENNIDKQQEEDNNQDELKEEIEENENDEESEIIEEEQDNTQEQKEDIKEEQEDNNTTSDRPSNNVTNPNTNNNTQNNNTTTSDNTTKPNTSDDTQNNNQTNDTGNNQNDSNTQNTTTNDTATEETEQNELITLKSITMENEGGTFKIGDTITWHVVIESEYPLSSVTMGYKSSVNNSTDISSNWGIVPSSNNEYNVTITKIITDNVIPGKWEFNFIAIWDKYNTMLSKYDFQLNYNSFFIVAE